MVERNGQLKMREQTAQMHPQRVELVFSMSMHSFHQQMAANGAFSINTLQSAKHLVNA